MENLETMMNDFEMMLADSGVEDFEDAEELFADTEEDWLQ